MTGDADTEVVARARAAMLDRFRWQDGHADVWRVFEHGPSLAAVVAGLAEPWRLAGIDRIAGVESRGFLLGAAVAVALGVGFVPLRKDGGVLPGRKLRTAAAPDYRGLRHRLRLQDRLQPDEVVLLVDDWAERGSQATAAKVLIERGGARWAGLSVLVDQLEPARRASLVRVTALVRADELGDSRVR